ncbi:MAG: DsbA family protein [Kofleriaceae bacterium]
MPAHRLFALAVLATACTTDTGPIDRKLDKLQAQIAALDQKVGGGGRPVPPAPRKRIEPDAKTVFAVPIAGNAFDGPADAPVTIVEAYEYACPACKNARTSLTQLREKYGDKVRVVYKQYIVHPDVATNAALAICAANKQHKFAEMDRVLWEKGFGGGRDFSQAKIEGFARDAELDLAKFTADVAGSCRDEVAREHAELVALGQVGTPTFFINGRYIMGASPVKLGAMIDEELALASQRIAGGTPPADYYRTWVLAKGAPRFDPPQS